MIRLKQHLLWVVVILWTSGCHTWCRVRLVGVQSADMGVSRQIDGLTWFTRIQRMEKSSGTPVAEDASDIETPISKTDEKAAEQDASGRPRVL